jgi:predicted DNA-binding transcriptional regulator AlpA
MRPANVEGVGVSAHAIASGADPIVSKRETALLVGVSVSTLDRMIRRKEFPRPLQLSVRRVGWPLRAGVVLAIAVGASGVWAYVLF